MSSETSALENARYAWRFAQDEWDDLYRDAYGVPFKPRWQARLLAVADAWEVAADAQLEAGREDHARFAMMHAVRILEKVSQFRRPEPGWWRLQRPPVRLHESADLRPQGRGRRRRR